MNKSGSILLVVITVISLATMLTLLIGKSATFMWELSQQRVAQIKQQLVAQSLLNYGTAFVQENYHSLIKKGDKLTLELGSLPHQIDALAKGQVTVSPNGVQVHVKALVERNNNTLVYECQVAFDTTTTTFSVHDTQVY